MVTFALYTALLSFGFAFLLLLGAHYVTYKLWGELHKIKCYIAGTFLISVVFGAWSVVQPKPMLASWGFVAYVLTVAGAGLGTVAGWWIDHKGDQRERHQRELESLKRHVRILEMLLEAQEHDGAVSE